MDEGFATSQEEDLRQRIGLAVRLWREATVAPLPRLDPDAPDRQVAALEMELVDLFAAQADPRRAADLQFQLAELTEGRPCDDPLTRRAEALRPVLRRLDERRAGPRGRTLVHQRQPRGDECNLASPFAL